MAPSSSFFENLDCVAVEVPLAMDRVKLYCSKRDDEWEDEGTGHLSVDSDSQTTGFVLKQENDSRLLLNHEIGVSGQNYALVEDTRIIRWTDAESGVQRALSFEKASHCKDFYAKLLVALEKLVPKKADAPAKPGKELPKLTLANLEAMVKMVEEAQPFARDQLFLKTKFSDFVRQLCQVFQQCEDLEDLHSLECCCRIARALVIHADYAMTEELFSDANALQIIGALEYDPDIPIRIKHREYLKERVRFKEVVPIADPEIVRKIHRVYRVQYVKDVVVTRLMDDPLFSSMAQMIVVGNVDVVNGLSVQPSFFEELFSKIRDLDPGTTEWTDLVGFLQEYCQAMRQLPPPNQLGILTKMRKLGLFNVLTDILRDDRPVIKLKAIDILSSSMSQDPSSLRNHVVLTPKHPLFQLLIENLMTGDQLGVTEHALEVVKSLMEPTEEGGANKYESFLEVFYGKFVHDLVDALTIGLPPERNVRRRERLPENVSARAKGAIVDLLSFCVMTHSYTVKYFILRGSVLEHIFSLLRSREKWLVVSTVRFLRTLLAMKDEFYDRIIQRADILGQVVEVFLANGDCNNLLNSAMLELFDFLRQNRRHEHIAHIVERYFDRLSSVSYVTTFQDLKTEYDKKKEGGASLSQRDSAMMSISSVRMKRDSRALEKEEEEYFAEGSDDTDDMPEISRGSSEMEIESAPEDDLTSEVSTNTGRSAKRVKGEQTRSSQKMSFETNEQQRQT